MERRDPDAVLPGVEAQKALPGVDYARRYLRHELWRRYEMEGMPEQVGMRHAITLLERLEGELRRSDRA